MDWHATVEEVTPYVVKIETPGGHGTGFLCLYNDRRTFCGIATAAHVIQHANMWREPIRIVHAGSNEPAFIAPPDRVIFSDADKDSAVILFEPKELKLPPKTIPMISPGFQIRTGVEVGWLGYPAIGPSALCFFAGNISADYGEGYFIDGVAISGVSGGPVFYFDNKEQRVLVVGTISAYYANVATGATLPGLSFAQGVSHFHDTIVRIKSLDDAAKQEQAEPVATPAPAPRVDRRPA